MATLTPSYFASGSNSSGEIAGFNELGHAVGVAVDQVKPAAIAALAECTVPVFVDSGAFGEVRFDPSVGRLVVKKPITGAEWRRRLELYREIVTRCVDTTVSIVAPDLVGDQMETLLRMERYASEVRELHQLGAQVIAPIQNGELSAAEMFAMVTEVLGFEPCAGIPSKKGATSTEDFTAFMRAAAPRDVHFLGLGPRSRRYIEMVTALDSTPFTCDSVLIVSLVGKTNGRGGGPRPMTAALNGLDFDAFYDGYGTAYTDLIYTPSEWMSRSLVRKLRDELRSIGLDVGECLRFSTRRGCGMSAANSGTSASASR